MSSDRLKTQAAFETILKGKFNGRWRDLNNSDIVNVTLAKSNTIVFQSCMERDSKDFYFKGLLSLYESLISFKNENFSWATVKAYYSTFYFLRASLLCKNIALARKERDMYYFRNLENEKPVKLSGDNKSDHKASIFLFEQFFEKSDYLQSNKVNDKVTYRWLMEQRENVNYKYRTFYEPDCPFFMSTILSNSLNDGFQFWLDKYISDGIYAFLEEHACLAIPLRRLILTHKDLEAKNIGGIANDKKAKLNKLIKENEYLENLKMYSIF